MNNIGLIIILFVMLTTGCANRKQVVAAPAIVGLIAASPIHPGTRVVTNLSEQRAYLIEGGKISLISPIASGKPGYSTPTGSFSILSKDIDHRSQSFGLVVDGSGRITNSNATPGTYVPPGNYYRPAPMPYYMQFSQAIGMHAGYLPGIPPPTAVCACLGTWRPFFSHGSKSVLRLRLTATRGS
jgi:hypothetical protein